MAPTGLLGIHLNTQYAFPTTIPEILSPDERRAVESLALYADNLGGSNHLQRTKPETVGFALADSPAGQAAWIYEKFQSKTDNQGLAEDALDVDDMLDVISLYWLTNSAASSGRIYWENGSAGFAGPTLTLPVAVTVFPADIPRLPRTWIEDTYRSLVHYGEANTEALCRARTTRDPGPRDPRRAAQPAFLPPAQVTYRTEVAPIPLRNASEACDARVAAILPGITGPLPHRHWPSTSRTTSSPPSTLAMRDT